MVRYTKWYSKRKYRRPYKRDYNLIHYKPNWKVIRTGQGLTDYITTPKKAKGRKGYHFWAKEPYNSNYYAYKYKKGKKRKKRNKYNKNNWSAW